MDCAQIEKGDFQKALHYAEANWSNWRLCWTHQGDWRSHPILATQVWFGCFVWEYGLGRTFTRTDAAKIRKLIRESESFKNAVEKGCADSLQAAVSEIMPLKQNGKERRNTSLITKVAAFVRPEKFIAWDTYASAGLRKLKGKRTHVFGDSISKYERLAQNIVTGEISFPWWTHCLPRIDQLADQLEASHQAIRMRVLDNIAMIAGARSLDDEMLPDLLVSDFAATANWGWGPLRLGMKYDRARGKASR